MAHIVTVVIATWNGAERIISTLTALAEQRCSPDLFEVIIVDNNSSDATTRVGDDHPGVNLIRKQGVKCKVVSEPTLGLTYARIRGVLEAEAELICFLDDDNVPETDYIQVGASAFTDPTIGILVSRVFPKYEQQPPLSIERREPMLAITQSFGESVIDLGASATFVPTFGAGMWLSRKAFLEAVPWQTPEKLMIGRKGKCLISGDDMEIGYLIGRAGYRRLYWPELRLFHLISRKRVTASYFSRLITGIARSNMCLNARYGFKKYGIAHRCLSLIILVINIMMTPLILLQRDGVREARFNLAKKWAHFMGPYNII